MEQGYIHRSVSRGRQSLTAIINAPTRMLRVDAEDRGVQRNASIYRFRSIIFRRMKMLTLACVLSTIISPSCSYTTIIPI